MVRRMGAIAVLAAIMVLGSCATTGLRSSTTKGFGPFSAQVPYANTVDYYGYVSPAVEPDGEVSGNDAFYLYVWVPAVLDEIGVSMYSPAEAEPEEGDFVSAAFSELFAADAEAYFDTYLVLEKMDIVNPENIADGGSVISTLNQNDDSREMQANPSGSSYNSLLRHISQASDPLQALTRGVYRISLTSFRGDVNGSYVATVGTNVPGAVIAASLEELHEAVNAAE